MNLVDFFKAARNLIENKDNWCVGAYAMTENGGVCPITDPNAKKFCAIGAMERVSFIHDDNSVLIVQAYGQLFKSGILSFVALNDARIHGHENVIKAYDKVISDLEAQDRKAVDNLMESLETKNENA